MNERRATFLGFFAVALGVFVYLYNLGSEHAATNPDEHLYWQITRMTAESGQWLPLKNLQEAERNTKPPALFWQGIVATDWGQHWELWRVRLPVALYTLATAALVLLLGRKLGGHWRTGIVASLAFLTFFSTYRYGRVVLTSAPETFWFFLPFFVLLYAKPQKTIITWTQALAFGLMVGAGLLYKSFALVVPFCMGLACWTLHQSHYRPLGWLRSVAPKIALLGIIAIGVFSLWFWLDPYPERILKDFILKENVGKFDPKGGSYIVNFFSGNYAIWRILFGYPFNAGLLAPAVVMLAVFAFRKRRELADAEKLLWIWVLTQIVFFAFPNQRDERYLLPAMPALAILLAMRWRVIPRWALVITLIATAAIAVVFGIGAIVLNYEAGYGQLYPWIFWVIIFGTAIFSIFGIRKKNLTHDFACPAVLLLYLSYAAFLIPFDGPRGEFTRETIDAVHGRTVILPTVYGAHDEVYRFMLPGCDVQTVRVEPPAQLEDMQAKHSLVILSVPARDQATEKTPGIRVLGTRLQLVDRFTGNQSKDMLRGNITGQLFQKDLLIETAE